MFSASRVFLVTGIISVLLSLWTNPAVFGRQFGWAPPHSIFLLAGFLGVLAGARLQRLERRIAELERRVGSEGAGAAEAQLMQEAP